MTFICCDLCDDTLPRSRTSAQFEIGYEDPSECPPATPSIPGILPNCDCDTFSERPDSIQFQIAPWTATLTQNQDSKAYASGADLTSCTSAYTITCRDDKDGGSFTVSPAGGPPGTLVTVFSQRATETQCTITCGGQSQTVGIHTSCSQPLVRVTPSFLALN